MLNLCISILLHYLVTTWNFSVFVHELHVNRTKNNFVIPNTCLRDQVILSLRLHTEIKKGHMGLILFAGKRGFHQIHTMCYLQSSFIKSVQRNGCLH